MKPEPVSLKLCDISRAFGSFTALHRTDLAINAGEFVSLLGPSGCGKTTTLRLIAGFELPDTGSIHIGGRDVTLVPPDRRKLGMVFQNYALFPHMTVAGNIAFGLRMAGMGRGEIETRVLRMLDMIHLPQYGERFPSQLSGGQQQRVAIARSLVTEPSVLLLDEPMAALDKNLRQDMQVELRQIQQNFGITTILVTHDQDEAMTMSDSIVVMQGGRIVQSGSPENVYDRPTSRFVTEFLGASNLIEAKVSGVSDAGRFNVAIPLGDGRFVETQARGEEGSVGEVLLSVRPERVSIHAAPLETSPTRVALGGKISRHVFRGASHSYDVTISDGGPTLLVYEQVGANGDAADWKVGQDVWVSWPAERQSVFPTRKNNKAWA